MSPTILHICILYKKILSVAREDKAVRASSRLPLGGGGAARGAVLPATTSVTVLKVDVPMQDEVSENCLEIHEVSTTVRNRPPQTVPELCSTPAVRGQAPARAALRRSSPGSRGLAGVAAPRWARACPTQGSVSQAGGAEVLQRARSRGAGRNAF